MKTDPNKSVVEKPETEQDGRLSEQVRFTNMTARNSITSASTGQVLWIMLLSVSSAAMQIVFASRKGSD